MMPDKPYDYQYLALWNGTQERISRRWPWLTQTALLRWGGVILFTLTALFLLGSYRLVVHTMSVASADSGHMPPLHVDVDYAVVEGRFDRAAGLNTWYGIRYAAPPTGQDRWRAPRKFAINPSNTARPIVDARRARYPRCPQTPPSPAPPNYAYQGDEDCLFLSVVAPPGAIRLPVIVHFHGGGYGAGGGPTNFAQMAEVNGYSFVGVSVQYRLGAFGFLAGTAVHLDGAVNAGLLDQHLALDWIQQNIGKFGGDKSRVTIVGQSSGGGSVLLQALAYGGEEHRKFFTSAIAASPYVPAMYNYNHGVPEQNYLKFATAAGCYQGPIIEGNADMEILQCLRNADTATLQNASFRVGSETNYGSWAFAPVVDGSFIRELPSYQLSTMDTSKRRANGVSVLTSHNSNEGQEFVDPNISTAEDFDNWLRQNYPMLTGDDILEVNEQYPYDPNATTRFATCGDCAHSQASNTMNTGPFATGHRQRAIAFYSEATFACPSYWLAGAFQGSGLTSYKYHISVPPGNHGIDLTAESLFEYTPSATSPIGPDFHRALTTIWGKYARTGNPRISNIASNGFRPIHETPGPCFSEGTYFPDNAAKHWSRFFTVNDNDWQMLNLNQTSGTPTTSPAGVTTCGGSEEVRNSFRQVSALEWEGGQGRRCGFLGQIGQRIPV